MVNGSGIRPVDGQRAEFQVPTEACRGVFVQVPGIAGCIETPVLSVVAKRQRNTPTTTLSLDERITEVQVSGANVDLFAHSPPIRAGRVDADLAIVDGPGGR